jgi:hypothetical protein
MNTRCPTHDVEMIKLPVLWGMPIPTADIGNNEIIGGCCIPEEAYEYGYRCPIGHEEFFLSKDGKLIPAEEIDNE